MKRSLIALAVIVLLGTGLFACSKQGATSAGPAAANDTAFADFVPADAIVTLAVPDVKRARAAWKTSAIYQIWNEPEMQAFLTKPLSRIPQSPELNTLLDKLEAIQAKNVFFSLATLDSKSPKLLAGLAFKGDAAALEPLLAKPKAELLKSKPNGKPGTVQYGNRTIETFDTDRGTLATVVTNGWYFASTDLALLKSVLDRVDGKSDAPPALAKDADFKASISRIPAGQETLAYFRAQPIIEKMVGFASAAGSKISDEQKAELQKIRALTATTGFDKGRLRDTLFLLAPGLKKYPSKLNLKSLPFTAPETMLFTAAVMPEVNEKQMTSEQMGEIGKALAAAGLEFKDLRAAVANEVALQADWANGALYPSPLISIEVKDRAAAMKIVTAVTAQPPTDGEWQSKTEDGVDYRVLSQKKSSGLSPTIAITGTHVIAGLNQMDVRAAVNRAKGNGGHLDGNAAFKSAMADVGKPEVSVFYLDAKALFEKLYGLGKSLTPMAQTPQVNEHVDLSKLPQTETISKHLSPVVWSSRETDNGILCESVGPLTANQMVITGAGLGALGAAMFKGIVPSPDKLSPPTTSPGSGQPDSSATPATPPTSGTASPTPPKPGG